MEEGHDDVAGSSHRSTLYLRRQSTQQTEPTSKTGRNLSMHCQVLTLSFSMPKSFGRKEKPVARMPLGQFTSPLGAGPVLPSGLSVRVDPKFEKKPPLALQWCGSCQ